MFFTHIFYHLKKYIALIVVSTGILISLSFTAPAHAQMVVGSPAYISTLQLLYARLQELQHQLALLQGSPVVQSCFTPVRSLSLGMAGTDIAALQSYLAQDALLYPQRAITGQYDEATKNAIKRLQARYGIVSAGSADTTGYGVVGPRTGALIAQLCRSAVVVPPVPVPPIATNSGLHLQELELDETPWNISDESRNDISFKLVNDTSSSRTINYEITANAADSNDSEPNNIRDSIEVGAHQTKTVTKTFEDNDFDLGVYEAEVSVTSNGYAETKRISFKTVDTDIQTQDLAIENISFVQNWYKNNQSTNDITFEVVNTFNYARNVDYTVLVKNSYGSTVFTKNATLTVPGNSRKEIEKTTLGKNDFAIGNYTVSVEIDPSDDIDEDDEDNNNDSEALTVLDTTPEKGAYRIYDASSTPNLISTNVSITQEEARVDCQARVAVKASIWCTWKNEVMVGSSNPTIRAARAALATNKSVPLSHVVRVSAFERDWSNSCLELKGTACVTVVTPGYRVTYKIGEVHYNVRTNLNGSTIRIEK